MPAANVEVQREAWAEPLPIHANAALLTDCWKPHAGEPPRLGASHGGLGEYGWQREPVPKYVPYDGNTTVPPWKVLHWWLLGKPRIELLLKIHSCLRKVVSVYR